MEDMFIEYGLIILSTIIALFAQFYIKHNYKKYSKKQNVTGVNGYEAARKILDSNGLEYVGINMVNGELSDHYDPKSAQNITFPRSSSLGSLTLRKSCVIYFIFGSHPASSRITVLVSLSQLTLYPKNSAR